jgi:hypothetical protein
MEMSVPKDGFLTVGDLVPDVSLPTLEGDTVNPRDFVGKRLIVFMWASW